MKSYKAFSFDDKSSRYFYTDEGTVTVVHGQPRWTHTVTDSLTIYTISGTLTVTRADGEATLQPEKVYTFDKEDKLSNKSDSDVEFLIFRQHPHPAVCDYVSVF